MEAIKMIDVRKEKAKIITSDSHQSQFNVIFNFWLEEVVCGNPIIYISKSVTSRFFDFFSLSLILFLRWKNFTLIYRIIFLYLYFPYSPFLDILTPLSASSHYAIFPCDKIAPSISTSIIKSNGLHHTIFPDDEKSCRILPQHE